MNETERRAEIRQAGEEQDHGFTTQLEGACIIDVLFDARDRPFDYRFLKINPAFEQQTGLHDVLGKSISEIVPGNEARWCEVYGEVALTGEPARFVNETKMLGRWFDVLAYKVGGPESRKVGIHFNDITEKREAEQELRRHRDHLDLLVRERTAELEKRNEMLAIEIKERLRAEESLRASEASYRALFENSMDAVFLSESDGVISAANRAACATFGMTAAELRKAGRAGIVDLTDPRVAPALRQRAGSGKVRCEVVGMRKDGTRFPAEISSVLLGNSGRSFVIVRDISERRQAEEEILALNLGLEKRIMERTAALEAAIREQESFSYSVSHDLRAPLRHINSFSTILLEEYGCYLPGEGRNYLERVCGATTKMGTLIDHLLELSRVNRTELRQESVNLSALAAEVALMLRETEPARSVEFSIEEGLQAEGDGKLLRQLLENLLGNAWKYSGGRSRARIAFGKDASKGPLTYFVTDNGAGFDMAYSEKLFEIFQRLHGAEFEGLGIGLATAKQIIQRHGGAIWAEGKVDEGATFYFSLSEPRGRKVRSQPPVKVGPT